MDGAPVDGGPDNPVQVCLDEPCRAYPSIHFVGDAPDDHICVASHRHPWRDGLIRLASFAAFCPLLYALIITPEALAQMKEARHVGWRTIAHRRRLYEALPRSHWLAWWCGFAPAFIFSSAASPLLLEWLFPPVGTVTVALYVVACSFVTVVGSRVWTRKRRESERAVLQHSPA